jgi:hypothetical protein
MIAQISLSKCGFLWELGRYRVRIIIDPVVDIV